MRLTVPVPAPVRRAVTRHRRVLAAVLAGLATLMAITTLRSTPEAPPIDSAVDPGVTATAGEVTVPVLLDEPSLTGSVAPGDVIDLISVDDNGQARVIVDRARVVERTGGGALTSSSPVILVAVPHEAALPLTAALATARISLLIHPTG